MATPSMSKASGWHRGLALLAILVALVLLLAACGTDTVNGHGDQHRGEHGDHDVSLAHIHGLGVNSADGDLYAASHNGVFRVVGAGPPEQIAGRSQDFMGFTIIGPDHFLGSGHPGPDDTDQPSHLGLIESTDAGQTWASVSLSGEADFHAMEAKHGLVYGYDSVSGELMVSRDRHEWDRRARLSLADIAVSPSKPGEVIATTEQGPARSTDGGRTFTPIDNAPTLVFMDWPSTNRLVGVAPNGALHSSDDGGATWTERGQVPGSAQAITTHGESEVYVATDSAIHHSTDDGRTFTVFQSL
jgi:predicted small secreted protein